MTCARRSRVDEATAQLGIFPTCGYDSFWSRSTKIASRRALTGVPGHARLLPDGHTSHRLLVRQISLGESKTG